ncbi:MAG: hypothetical protein A3I72_15150 [Candidatus Tectomicrobia bacterium RIFCSPLOWO2_02_FULL_70_19]|nr:MAG: hypothetical protein A3I72_15150 [Candidatus Tectomicrobia bacterium RIFCSPLOWO2_02_FULL_70_19]
MAAGAVTSIVSSIFSSQGQGRATQPGTTRPDLNVSSPKAPAAAPLEAEKVDFGEPASAEVTNRGDDAASPPGLRISPGGPLRLRGGVINTIA